MQEPPVPLDETVRLLSLHSLRIMDTAPEERFDRVTRMAKRIFDVNICLVSLVDSDRQWFKSRQGLDACETPRAVSFCGHAILEERAFVIEDAHTDPRFADNPLVTGDPNVRFYAGYPVHSREGNRIGTLCLVDDKPRSFSAKDVATLKDFAALVDDELASAAEINVDELTKVANRRGFQQVAHHLLPLCKRNNLEVEVLFFDLDGFKALNDKFGHEAGDEALQAFAKLLLKSFRNSDVVARLGGDEFVVLMAGQQAFSDRALKRMQKRAKDVASNFSEHLGWSVGRARFDPDRHDDIDDLLREADERMYADKSRRKKGTA
ncbi:MAG: sensor domain-containing diguanylate cyclase [Gammaproteobacteria bacterium]|nr:sensor domain-containing diguanylate cyclase [Gammaproteobacteria bacterium]MDH3363483.1 sensor domain-containing diguanylate cyclase [Gammaproteobacteria bacterium]MDH3481642.1 sensor domain-containing diguanylate cyclase [Gammaproteobacteria bacterium]